MTTKPKSKSTPGASARPVLFELINPKAHQVFLAGTFNDWKPKSTPMIPVGFGRWAKELLLRPGRHEYRFVVDGHWLTDPAAKETTPNPFGERNAVVVVRPLVTDE